MEVKKKWVLVKRWSLLELNFIEMLRVVWIERRFSKNNFINDCNFSKMLSVLVKF